MGHNPNRRRPWPAVVPPRGRLSETQQIKLAEHLTAGLDLPDAAQVFYAVEHWWFFGPASATADAQKWHAESVTRATRIADLARELQREMHAEHECEDIIAHAVDWPVLDAALDRIGGIARRLAGAPATVRRGPRPRGWRDALIALIHAHYPPDKIAIRQLSHFEDTIGLLLGYLGEDLKDVHVQIVRTLARKPHSPFTMQVDDPRTEPRRYLPWSAVHLRVVRPT